MKLCGRSVYRHKRQYSDTLNIQPVTPLQPIQSRQWCNSFPTVVIFGIANAAGIIIGKSIGSGKIERAKVEAKTLKYLSYVIGIIACGVILLLKNFVINFYTIPPETRALANELMVTIRS